MKSPRIQPWKGIGLSHLLTYFSLIAGLLGLHWFLITKNPHAIGLGLALCFIFDAFDGKYARWIKSKTNLVSDFAFSLGEMLDSLTDFVVFGFIPTFFIFALLNQSPQTQGDDSMVHQLFISACGVFFLISSLTRLAVFHQASTKPGQPFIGIPTTLSGLFLSLVLLVQPSSTQLALVMLALAILMIAPFEIQRPSLKALLFLLLIALISIGLHATNLGLTLLPFEA